MVGSLHIIVQKSLLIWSELECSQIFGSFKIPHVFVYLWCDFQWTVNSKFDFNFYFMMDGLIKSYTSPLTNSLQKAKIKMSIIVFEFSNCGDGIIAL